MHCISWHFPRSLTPPLAWGCHPFPRGTQTGTVSPTQFLKGKLPRGIGMIKWDDDVRLSIRPTQCTLRQRTIDPWTAGADKCGSPLLHRFLKISIQLLLHIHGSQILIQSTMDQNFHLQLVKSAEAKPVEWEDQLYRDLSILGFWCMRCSQSPWTVAYPIPCRDRRVTILLFIRKYGNFSR